MFAEHFGQKLVNCKRFYMKGPRQFNCTVLKKTNSHIVKRYVIAIFFTGLSGFQYSSARGQIDSSFLNKEKVMELNAEAAKLNRDSTNKALTLAHEAYLLALKEGNKLLQAQTLLKLSEGYLYNDNFGQALDYAYKSLDLFDELKYDSGIAEANTMLGWVFYDSENPSLALDFHRRANKLYVRLNQGQRLSFNYNAIGLAFLLNNENDSAVYFFRLALELSERDNMKQMKAAILNNLGITENKKGQFLNAIEYFRKSLENKAPLGDNLSMAETLNQLAFSYLSLHEFKKADSLVHEARNLIEESNSNSAREVLLDNLRISSQLYQDLGNYEKAYRNLQDFVSINEEMLVKSNAANIVGQHLKRETRIRENEIEKLQSQRKTREFQIFVLLGFIILLVVIGFLFYEKFRDKIKREKMEEIGQRRLISERLKSTITEKEKLNSKIEFMNSNLEEFVLFESQNNKLLNDFLDKILEVLTDNDVRKEIIIQYKKLRKIYSADYENRKELWGYNLDFGVIQSDFMYKLSNELPDLTENERRLCWQIKMNLSSKDIAEENHISVKSVEMARYRLRQRLKLTPGQNLFEFLSRL